MPQVSQTSSRRRVGSRRAPWLAALVLCAAAPACPAPNTLEGSLAEVVDLRFDSVELAVTQQALILGYHRKSGEARESVFKLVVAVPPQTVEPGVEIELAPGSDGEPRAVATRAVGEESIRTFAEVRRGRLLLDCYAVVNEPCSGEFRVTLGEGGDAGEGRAAFGSFQVDAVVPGE